MSWAPEVFDAQDVAFADVEERLRALWKSPAESAGTEGKPPVTRVVTMNLIVVAGTEADAERSIDEASQLSGRHPARVLLVQTRSGAEGVSASLSILCHGSDGGRQLCSEQIRIVASGKAALRIAQHVAPMLVADVPVVLWLPNHPLLLPVDEDLLALADRVVVDSRAFPEAAAALDRLASWIERRREVVDLAWLRLERWRALTAQFFESPDARHDLDLLETVEVRYRTSEKGSPEGRVEALYYLAWLASRLGGRWEHAAVREGAAERFAARRSDRRRMELSLIAAVRPSGAPGDLSGVSIVADGGRCQYEVARLAEHDVAEVTVRAPRACPKPVRVGFPERDRLELLSLAISGMAHDPLYGQALRGAQALAAAH